MSKKQTAVIEQTDTMPAWVVVDEPRKSWALRYWWVIFVILIVASLIAGTLTVGAVAVVAASQTDIRSMLMSEKPNSFGETGAAAARRASCDIYPICTKAYNACVWGY